MLTSQKRPKSAQWAPASFVGDLTLSALAKLDQKKRPYYEALIDQAFIASPPAYGKEWFGDQFRAHGRDAGWVASLMASDAYMEGYSAGRLWQYAGVLKDESLASAMRRHAMDEAKHSKIFTRTFFKAFPSLLEEDLQVKLDAYSPDLAIHPGYPDDFPKPSELELLNSMILINLYEIKALLLGKLMQPIAVAHAPEENKELVHKMLGTIIADEVHHIRYSADYIEQACRDGHSEFVGSALQDFQQTMNQIVETELDADQSTAFS